MPSDSPKELNPEQFQQSTLLALIPRLNEKDLQIYQWSFYNIDIKWGIFPHLSTDQELR